MDFWHEDSVDDLLSADECIDAVAMSFFSAIGHTCTSSALSVDSDPMHFVYGTLATKTVLSQTDRVALLSAKCIALLFVIDSSVFDYSENGTINYFSVDLSVPRGDRSVAASAIQMVIAKTIASNTVILFRSEDSFMLSFYLKNSDGIGSVVLSDWLSTGSHDSSYYESLAAYNLSFASAKAFYLDFCYAAARHYYTYPCSREFARYVVFPTLFSNGEERESLTRDDISDIIRGILLEPIIEYGDDYIDDELLSSYSDDELEDTDFDLLEYELEQMGAFDEGFQDSPLDDEFELVATPAFSQSSSFDSSAIPADVMRDPVKLLSWLEDCEKNKHEDASGCFR